VYKGLNVKTGEKVVIKTEPEDVPYSTLKRESAIMNMLYSNQCKNIPPTYWYGKGNKERIIVMPMYDIPLLHYVSSRVIDRNRFCRRIVRSMIRTLSHIHTHYVVHRDIKPENWMIHNNELMLIDFGLASFYVDADANHLSPANPPKQKIIGTPKYASWNIHCGEEYSRRDDLISTAYIALVLLDEMDTWIPPSTVDRKFEPDSLLGPLNQWFKNKKQLNYLIMEINEKWLIVYLQNLYNIRFTEAPDYDKLENIMKDE
jgi:casein kinase 1